MLHYSSMISFGNANQTKSNINPRLINVLISSQHLKCITMTIMSLSSKIDNCIKTTIWIHIASNILLSVKMVIIYALLIDKWSIMVEFNQKRSTMINFNHNYIEIANVDSNSSLELKSYRIIIQIWNPNSNRRWRIDSGGLITLA